MDCRDCEYFDSSRSFCLMLNAPVYDVTQPPCLEETRIYGLNSEETIVTPRAASKYYRRFSKSLELVFKVVLNYLRLFSFYAKQLFTLLYSIIVKDLLPNTTRYLELVTFSSLNLSILVSVIGIIAVIVGLIFGNDGALFWGGVVASVGFGFAIAIKIAEFLETF
ncbi:MAG: hypothetical protein J7J67_03535 [Thermoproteales archaeon]|nr:hypothetical protein [Thermoproteales archaeon]